MNRRDFLLGSAGALGVMGLPAALSGVSSWPGNRPEVSLPDSAPARRALRILILGGTGFIGPHQVRSALERGHALTLFNRGRTAPNLHSGVETLIGDRDGDLRALEGRRWDCVIDNSGFSPEQITLSAGLLRDAVDQYLFVSTQSVYADRSVVGQDETGPVGRPGVPEEEWTGYGPLKALCEKELHRLMPGRATVLRPAVIVGPGDASDRFTYWIDRVARGGEILAPGRPEDPTQFIDVRDLCDWTVRMVEAGTTGTFNTTGPASELSVAGLLYGIRAVTSIPMSFTWTSRSFLQDEGVRPFSDLPLWMVPEGNTAGFMRMSAERARAAGLTYRPLADTAASTLAWWREQPEDRRLQPLRAGVSPDSEAALLSAWRRRVDRFGELPTLTGG